MLLARLKKTKGEACAARGKSLLLYPAGRIGAGKGELFRQICVEA